MKGVFAPTGSYIPGTDLTLKASKIRGEESNGMLCSMREMGLGQDHDGIIDLAADAPVGQSFAAYMGYDDPVFEIKLTPDRVNALSPQFHPPRKAVPLVLAAGTALDTGKLAAAAIGLALQAGALAALAVYASSGVPQPAFAAAIAVALNLLLTVVDAGARLQGVSNGLINYLALPTHLEPFFRGIVASVDALYFALLALLALGLATRRLGALRSLG